MKRIPLTKGQYALVDDRDYDWLTRYRWSCSNKGYAVHYTKINGVRKVLYMHRLIMDAPPRLQVDHIDQNRLNNCRNNLRLATTTQNAAHRRLRTTASQPFKGITARCGRYDARIGIDWQRIYLGRFRDPVRAALAYDAAAKLLYGEFAQLNFPEVETPPEIMQQVLAKLAPKGLVPYSKTSASYSQPD